MIRIEPTTIGHLIDFRENVRGVDLAEIEKLTGVPFDAQLVSILAGCQTVLTGDCVLGIGGIDNNVIWLVTTMDVERYQIEFLRFSKRYLKDLLDQHGFLVNYAFTRNQLHINWLNWLGAHWIDKQGDFSMFILRKKE